MRLSIVIVNWNAKKMLSDCLRSVVRSIDPRYDEIIVVDNGSADGSVTMVTDEFPSVRLIPNTDNRGFAAANNQGLSLARGRYVLLLNNDTIIHGDVMVRSCRYMDTHGDVAVLGCRVLNEDGSLQQTCSQYPSPTNLLLLTSGLWKLRWPRFLGRYQIAHWDRDSELDVDTVSGCYMLVRSSAIEEVGALDERFFFFGEETDWCKRFRDAGWVVRFAPVGQITHFGSVSARRHNHRRDIMLSDAMVRLHRKHSGLFLATLVWALLLLFNTSRAAFWGLCSLFSRDNKMRVRFSHFLGVVRDFGSVWPSLPETRP